MSKFDFLGVFDEGTAKMTIMNPNTGLPYQDNAGVSAYIEIGHIHGPEGRRYDNDRQRLAAAQDPLPGMTATDSYLIRKLAALTKSWYLVGTNGEPVDLPFTTEAAEELYAHRWMYMQLVPFVSSYANFSKASPKS